MNLLYKHRKIRYILIIIGTILSVFFITSSFSARIPELGGDGDYFPITLKSWKHYKKYQEVHTQLRSTKDSYLLIEARITNGSEYEYYFVNLDQYQIDANFLGVNGFFKVNKEFIDTTNQLLSNLNSKNQIYDGTADVATDDIVIVLTYHNQKSTIKLGTYSLRLGYIDDKYKQFKSVIINNKIIIDNLLYVIEGEINRQRPQLFEKRLFLQNAEDIKYLNSLRM